MAVKKGKVSSIKRNKHVKAKKNIAPNQQKKKKAEAPKRGIPKLPKNNNNANKKTVQNGKPQQQKKKRVRGTDCGVPELKSLDIDSDLESDILDMVDCDSKNIATYSSSSEDEGEKAKAELSRKINENFNPAKKAKKRKPAPEEELNIEDYERDYKVDQGIIQSSTGKIKELLPIKTKTGIIPREMKVESEKKKAKKEVIEEGQSDDDDQGSFKDDSDEEVLFDENDDDEQGTEDGEAETPTAVTMADLMIHRENELQKQKFKIGIICSGILEQPEDRVKNFGSLFELMEARTKDNSQNLLSVRKIALISATEVFKDILPDYKLGIQEMENLKLKKTTLNRVAYENVLLTQYKRYLQYLDRYTLMVSKKRKDLMAQHVVIAEVATKCLCELLVANPNFNYSQNIAQTLVFLSNVRFPQIRELVNKCFKRIFATDTRLDLTYFIIRRINNLVKTKDNNVHCDVLTPLLLLDIKDINLDADKEKEIKGKKMEARKSRLINMSKREKKRQKKLKELEHEMMETKAEENKQNRGHKLTEIVKMVFNVYFRILKKEPNSKLLATTLEGLAKFAHCINLEFFSDLVNVLNQILDQEDLGYREQLHCIHTVFVMLSGQGEVLNIDPIRFYSHIYRLLFIVHAGKNHSDFLVLVRTLTDVLLKRRKQITQLRLLAFTKRIMTLSLQLLHNGTMSCLALIKSVMQTTSKSVDLLLDTESFIGSGRYDPELDDPEYCNANCTLIYELTALARHYHPIVAKLARHLSSGAPTSGEGCLNPEIGKLTADDFFLQYDSSSMAFKPTITPPNPKNTVKAAKGSRHIFTNTELETECHDMLKKVLSPSADLMDFNKDLSRKLK